MKQKVIARVISKANMEGAGSDEVLAQFDRLIEELLDGNLHRSTFQPWEIVILVDLAACYQSEFSKRRSILREYQGAVQRQMQAGARTPLKLSEYMASLQVSGNPIAKQPAAGAQGN